MGKPVKGKPCGCWKARKAHGLQAWAGKTTSPRAATRGLERGPPGPKSGGRGGAAEETGLVASAAIGAAAVAAAGAAGAAAAEATAAAAAAASTAVFAGLGLVDRQRPAVELGAVEGV